MTEKHDNVGTASEIEALRQRVAALEASEAELRAIFQAMTDVVLVASAEGRYLKIAPTGPDLLYRPSDELLGKTFHDVLPPEMADLFLTNVHTALDLRRVVTLDYTLPIQGREVYFVGHISPLTEDTVVLVARDVSERRMAQRALEESREQLIRAQQAALAELSTPLIPISDEIVVMPLIGVLDSRRMDQVMQTLLDGILAKGASVAILDVTGISVIDSEVADSVLRVARAAELLGARVILTGIRPHVAHTLVSIGADLGGIAARSTLQSGIAYAMACAR